jgi:hypothetical protein
MHEEWRAQAHFKITGMEGEGYAYACGGMSRPSVQLSMDYQAAQRRFHVLNHLPYSLPSFTKGRVGTNKNAAISALPAYYVCLGFAAWSDSSYVSMSLFGQQPMSSATCMRAEKPRRVNLHRPILYPPPSTPTLARSGRRFGRLRSRRQRMSCLQKVFLPLAFSWEIPRQERKWCGGGQDRAREPSSWEWNHPFGPLFQTSMLYAF